MSKVNSLHHVVFGTKGRIPALNPSESVVLHQFIWDQLKELDCYLYRVNSMPDHIHMIFNLNPTKSLSEVIRTIKANSSAWLRKLGKFPLFKGWCSGYYAASVAFADKEAVIEYIKAQQVHHGSKNYVDEMKMLYMKSGLNWHDADLG